MERLSGRGSGAFLEDGNVILVHVVKGVPIRQPLGKPNDAEKRLQKMENDADRNNLILNSATVPTVILSAAGVASGIRERSPKKVVGSVVAGIVVTRALRVLSDYFKGEVGKIASKRERIEDLAA